jgi:hypothetical protein
MANRFFPNYETYKITSPFGMRTLRGKTAQHNGIDLVARASNGGSRTDYITAHSGGVVDGVGYDASAGYFVRIKVAEGVYMSYFHMKEKSTLKRGQTVKQGDIIGYMGNTGNTTGAHLHFGIKVNGKWIDPQPYLDKDYILNIPTANKSIDEIAKEVIEGKWGNGQERKNKLSAAGYDYSSVQARVNALLKGKPQTTTPKPTPKPTVNKPVYNVDDIARKVIRGDYGNGAKRKKALTALGYDYAVIQKRVNELLKKK